MPLVLPPSLDHHLPISSASVQADLDCLCFPQISDQQFLKELREAQRPVALVQGRQVPLLASNLSSDALGSPLNVCPPGEWLQAHLNAGLLEKYLQNLQSSIVLQGGSFSEKTINTGQKAFETFLEAGSAAVRNRFGLIRFHLSLEDSQDLAALVSRLHKGACKDMGRKCRLRKDAEAKCTEVTEIGQLQDLDLSVVEAFLGCGVAEPSKEVKFQSTGWANGKICIPPNLFQKMDNALQKQKVSKRNPLFKRLKQSQAIKYSIFDFKTAKTAFFALGVTDPFLKFTNGKGISFEGWIDQNHPLTVRYSAKSSLLCMHFLFRTQA